MNFKLAAFIVVVIFLLLLVRLEFSMYIPQGYSRFQKMKTSILQHLNNAMSTSETSLQESKKKMLRFKLGDANTLNDRIAKLIAKESSAKDSLEKDKVIFINILPTTTVTMISIWSNPKIMQWAEEFLSRALDPSRTRLKWRILQFLSTTESTNQDQRLWQVWLWYRKEQVWYGLSKIAKTLKNKKNYKKIQAYFQV